MKIISMKLNCMGTMDFTLKIGKMKKAEEFTTYPIQKGDNTDVIFLQSEHRWVQLNTKTGEIEMSARRAQYANAAWFVCCKINKTIETDSADVEQLKTMLSAIRKTAGDKVGDNMLHIFSDNSNAALV